MKNSEKLIRIAKKVYSYTLDSKLFNAKSKRTAINIIYRNIGNLTRGIFRDDNWSNVRRVWNRLEQMGLDVNVQVKNGGYFNDKTTGKVAGKQYNFDFSYTNVEGKVFKFQGQLVCSFCGTVDDLMSAYDISFILY